MTIITDRIATANVYSGLTHDEALDAVLKVTARDVDALGLQEWGRGRSPVLAIVERRTGLKFRRPLTGGGPIGVDRRRYSIVRCRASILALPGRVDKSPGRRRFLGASVATVLIVRDHLLGEEVALVNYHLTAEVQHGAGYRDDRPLRVARHRDREVPKLERLIRRQKRKGRTVYAVGDSNYDGLELDGVTSAWAGRHNDPRGTHDGGRRKIDDVHGPGPADDVELVANAGDHDALIATRRRTR